MPFTPVTSALMSSKEEAIEGSILRATQLKRTLPRWV